MVIKMKKGQKRGLPPPPPEEELQRSQPELSDQDQESIGDEPHSTDSAIEIANEESKQKQPTNNEEDSHDDDDDDEMDLKSFVKPKKKRKKGIIYISNIPKHMNVTRIREILGEYGKIGRVYLQPEKRPNAQDKKKKRRKRLALHFTEGWVEFESKRVAKQIVPLLNNKQISARKKSQFYDYIWSMKYLPRFKWVHLTERMNYEQAVHKQRLMTEVSQARKETTFFQNNLDKSEYLKKKNKKANKAATAAASATQEPAES